MRSRPSYCSVSINIIHTWVTILISDLRCSWFPFADLDRLKTAVAFVIWVFMWDDEIDSDTTTANDEKIAHAYCAQSLEYIRGILGFGPSSTEDLSKRGSPCSQASAVMEMFTKFGRHLGEQTSDSMVEIGAA